MVEINFLFFIFIDDVFKGKWFFVLIERIDFGFVFLKLDWVLIFLY